MKILLLYPFGTYKRIVTEDDASQTPIGLYYLGAVLKEKGYNVDVENWHTHSQKKEDIQKSILQIKPDVIAISVFQANRHGAMLIGEIAKELLPKTKIVFGGVGASTLWEFFLTHASFLDAIVIGEGEISFPLLLEEFQKPSLNLENVPGIAFKKHTEIIKTPPSIPVTLDELPDPALYYHFNYVSSSRGCPGGCAFCGSPALWGRKVRTHGVAWFVTHLERLCQKGIQFFYISDDTFTLQKDRVIEICKEIIDRKLKIEWAAISRVDCVDAEILTWIRKAGCIQISYGVESADPAIRKWLGKQILDEDIQNAFQAAISVGILPRAYFIYGTSEETVKTANITLEKIKKWQPLAAIFYMLEIFPGTRLYEGVKKMGKLSDDYWLKESESVAWAEIAKDIDVTEVLRTGKALRENYKKILPELALNLSFVNEENLYPYQADFLSRLAMTFSHGEYRQIPEARKVAKKLLDQALSRFPNARAFWGKGLLAHEEGTFSAAEKLYREGIQLFPTDVLLHIYLGYTLLSLGRPEEAMDYFERYKEHPDAKMGLAQAKRQMR